MKEKNKYLKPEYLENRELSWLQFNKRILAEAKDKTILPFERIKFLSITASNLDEFFMIRVASLMDMVHAGYTKRDIAGMTAKEQLAAILPEAKEFMADQYKTLNRSLMPLLDKCGLHIVHRHEDLTEKQASYVSCAYAHGSRPIKTISAHSE